MRSQRDSSADGNYGEISVESPCPLDAVTPRWSFRGRPNLLGSLLENRQASPLFGEALETLCFIGDYGGADETRTRDLLRDSSSSGVGCDEKDED
jgi:hypothetical protein